MPRDADASKSASMANVTDTVWACFEFASILHDSYDTRRDRHCWVEYGPCEPDDGDPYGGCLTVCSDMSILDGLVANEAMNDDAAIMDIMT